MNCSIKKCHRCLIEKSRGEFPKPWNGGNFCILCKNIKWHEWKNNNIEHYDLLHKKSVEKNRVNNRLQQNKRRANNRDVINAKKRESRRIKKEARLEKERLEIELGVKMARPRGRGTGLIDREIVGHVYKVTCTIYNKAYIGVTTCEDPQERILQHLGLTRSGTKLLCRAIEKHGKEAFRWEILDKTNSSVDLGNKEKFYIKEHNTLAPNGYNCTEGGYTIEFITAPIKRMDTGEIYNSIKEAAINNEIKAQCIRSYLCGITRSAKGIIFRYIDESKNVKLDNKARKGEINE